MMQEKNHKGAWCHIIGNICQEGLCSNCDAYFQERQAANYLISSYKRQRRIVLQEE